MATTSRIDHPSTTQVGPTRVYLHNQQGASLEKPPTRVSEPDNRAAQAALVRDGTRVREEAPYDDGTRVKEATQLSPEELEALRANVGKGTSDGRESQG